MLISLTIPLHASTSSALFEAPATANESDLFYSWYHRRGYVTYDLEPRYFVEERADGSELVFPAVVSPLLRLDHCCGLILSKVHEEGVHACVRRRLKGEEGYNEAPV